VRFDTNSDGRPRSTTSRMASASSPLRRQPDSASGRRCLPSGHHAL